MAKVPICAFNPPFLLQTGKERRLWASLWGGLILTSMLWVSVAWAQADTRYTSKRLEPPRASLNQPFDSPIFLGVYGQLGGGFDFDQGQLGYGAMFVIRPGAAANFLNFLYDWNSSLVCQADYQRVSPTNRILSGDLVIRHYLDDMRDSSTPFSPFLGAGVGASEVTLPAGAGASKDRYWSFLVEFGQEWNFPANCLVFTKGQFRYYNFGGYNFSTWSIQAGFGIPLPW